MIEINYAEKGGEIKELTLTNKRAPLFPIFAMGFFMVAAFILPIIITMLYVTENEGLHFGLVILYVICGLCGRWMLKLILWNLKGQEHFKFKKDTICYQPDYSWFTGKQVIINTNELELNLDDRFDPEGNQCKLSFKNGKESIDSVIKIDKIEASSIMEKVKQYY